MTRSGGFPKWMSDHNSRGGEKLFTYDKFRITDISYNGNREITGLTIINQNGNIVYILREKGSAQKSPKNAPAGKTRTQPDGNSATAKTGQKPETDRTQEINKEWIYVNTLDKKS